MKKGIWILYGFVNFVLNCLITKIISDGLFEDCIFGILYARSFYTHVYCITYRIDGILTLVFYLSVYVMINMIIYKLLIKKRNINTVYLLIPIGTMVLGIIMGYFWNY